nr:hypothetical protein B0A51_06923 [Rachicladosporium sp. CCFEE 5018]
MADQDLNKDEAFSHNKAVKEGWGDWPNFLASYGLKPTPDGYKEGKQIVKIMLEAGKNANKSQRIQYSGVMERK